MQSRTKVSPFITVALAEDLEHARQCQRMLREKNIEAVVKPNDPSADDEGVPVLVPQALASQARDILSFQNSPDDFSYFGFDDAGMSDCDEE